MAANGPYLAPCGVHHAAHDPRDGSIWAAVNGDAAWVYRSPDLGASWEPVGGPLPATLVWHVEPGRAEEPGMAYAGVMPAALYRTRDGGETWQPLDGLNRHPSRAEWWEGGGGLYLHTIVLPPDRPGRIYAGISVPGLFRSDDGGETWTPVNEGVDAIYNPEAKIAHPGVHRCLHKVVLHPADSGILFQQNHMGVFRSDDAGERWRRIDAGLPSSFGFPIAVGADPNGPIFVVPQDECDLRTVDHLAVWRSVDGGATWIEGRDGLPAGRLNVLREAMATDARSPSGVYLGTTEGGLYASVNAGQTWSTLAEDLPRICSVKVAHVD